MARFDYVGCEFQYFWRDLSREALRDYALRLDHVFQEKDHRDGFSSAEVVKRFQNHLEHFDPHSNPPYRFDFRGGGSSETWQITFRVTQIPHVEGGIVRPSAQPGNRLRFAHSLLEHRVANAVEISEFVKGKGIRRLLPKYPVGTVIGEGVYLYLWRRLLKILSLRRKLRSEVLSGDSFNFDGFLDVITRALESTHANIVELDYGSETSDEAAFMQRSDEALLSKLDSGELRRLFALIELSPTQWFGS